MSIEYYLSLATSQYQNAPNFLAWLRAVLQVLEDVSLLGSVGYGGGPYGGGPYGFGAGGGSVFSLVNAFDLDQAVGAQLDILGQIVGVSRHVNFTEIYGNQPSFGCDLNNALVAGFDTGFWAGFTTPTLDDPTYRILIKAKIAQNEWNGQAASLWPIWQSLFPGGFIIVQDHQDMTATIVMAGTFSQVIIDLIKNGLIVPRPQAVQYNYIFAKLPIFGFDNKTSFVSGFDQGFMPI